MPDTTLAQVLEAHDGPCKYCGHVRAEHVQGRGCVGWADDGSECPCGYHTSAAEKLALQYVLAHRAGLERLEQWRTRTEAPRMPPEGTVAEMRHMLAFAEEPVFQFVMGGRDQEDALREHQWRCAGAVAVVAEWFKDNATGLERMDLNALLLSQCDYPNVCQVVLTRANPDMSPTPVKIETCANYPDSCNAICVGVNWRPEVKP